MKIVKILLLFFFISSIPSCKPRELDAVNLDSPQIENNYMYYSDPNENRLLVAGIYFGDNYPKAFQEKFNKQNVTLSYKQTNENTGITFDLYENNDSSHFELKPNYKDRGVLTTLSQVYNENQDFWEYGVEQVSEIDQYLSFSYLYSYLPEDATTVISNEAIFSNNVFANDSIHMAMLNAKISIPAVDKNNFDNTSYAYDSNLDSITPNFTIDQLTVKYPIDYDNVSSKYLFRTVDFSQKEIQSGNFNLNHHKSTNNEVFIELDLIFKDSTELHVACVEPI